MDDKIKNFILQLTEKTKNKEVIWDESNFNSQNFRYKFNNGLIKLWSYYDNDTNCPEYYMSITNNAGRIVYNSAIKNYPENESKDLNIIEGLYDAVYKQIYNTEEVIDGILEELKSTSDSDNTLFPQLENGEELDI